MIALSRRAASCVKTGVRYQTQLTVGEQIDDFLDVFFSLGRKSLNDGDDIPSQIP
jgi:hypothetical protein